MDEKDYDLIFDFQVVFIPDEPGKAGMLVPQLAYHDVKNVYLLGTNLWHSEVLIKHAEPYVQGAIMSDAFFASSAEPPTRRFVAAFEQTFQEKPGFIEAIAYDTATILFDAVSRPGVRFRRMWLRYCIPPRAFLEPPGSPASCPTGTATRNSAFWK